MNVTYNTQNELCVYLFSFLSLIFKLSRGGFCFNETQWFSTRSLGPAFTWSNPGSATCCLCDQVQIT